MTGIARLFRSLSLSLCGGGVSVVFMSLAVDPWLTLFSRYEASSLPYLSFILSCVATPISNTLTEPEPTGRRATMAASKWVLKPSEGTADDDDGDDDEDPSTDSNGIDEYLRLLQPPVGTAEEEWLTSLSLQLARRRRPMTTPGAFVSIIVKL